MQRRKKIWNTSDSIPPDDYYINMECRWSQFISRKNHNFIKFCLMKKWRWRTVSNVISPIKNTKLSVGQTQIPEQTRNVIRCQGWVSLPCWPFTSTLSPISYQINGVMLCFISIAESFFTYWFDYCLHGKDTGLTNGVAA